MAPMILAISWANIPYTAITIIFIVLATGVGAFIRRRSRDKCLRDFERNRVTLENKAGKAIWGKLRVENTGLEFIYPEMQKDEDGHFEASFILYKHEFDHIDGVLFIDRLAPTDRLRVRPDLDALEEQYQPR